MADPIRDDPAKSRWRADFRSAEEHRLDASLSVSAAERLKWLEEALAFAARVGALPRKSESD